MKQNNYYTKQRTSLMTVADHTGWGEGVGHASCPCPEKKLVEKWLPKTAHRTHVSSLHLTGCATERFLISTNFLGINS